MKLCVPLIVCMLLCFYMNGQSLSECYFPKNFASLISTNTKILSPVTTSNFCNSPMMSDSSMGATFYDNAYYLQKSRAQQFNGLVLMAGGSFIGAMGIRNELNRIFYETEDAKSGNDYKMEKLSYTKLAVTGLVLMAGSIPYFISALRNKNKVGLKLTCQKTSFGASPKACKKVTSLTFGIPIGR